MSKLATDNDCLDGYDEALECPILNEDKVFFLLFTLNLKHIFCSIGVRFNGD